MPSAWVRHFQRTTRIYTRVQSGVAVSGRASVTCQSGAIGPSAGVSSHKSWNEPDFRMLRVGLSRGVGLSHGTAQRSRPLHLLFGTANTPHPDKKAKGGEDAFFADPAIGAFGVADGVGGSARHGVDPGNATRLLTLTRSRSRILTLTLTLTLTRTLTQVSFRA